MKKTDFVDLEELKKVNSKDNNILKSKVNEKEKGKVGNLLGGGEIRFFEDLNFKHGFFRQKMTRHQSKKETKDFLES